jgi:hypothetical protein
MSLRRMSLRRMSQMRRRTRIDSGRWNKLIMKAHVDETDLTNDDPLMFGAIIVSRECSKANEDVTPM